MVITNDAGACGQHQGYESCYVTYTITLSVPAGMCGSAGFDVYLSMSTCATGAPSQQTDRVRITQSGDNVLPVMPAVSASACAYTEAAPPERSDCTTWKHPPALLLARLLA